MITTTCPCGGSISYPPPRIGETPKDVRHLGADGQPTACPLDEETAR